MKKDIIYFNDTEFITKENICKDDIFYENLILIGRRYNNIILKGGESNEN